MRAALRGEALWVAAGSLAAATLYWLPAFRAPASTGLWDWQYFHHMWEAAFVAVTRHRELPLWDPYHCGGVTLYGNPQSQVYSPLFLLAFAVGPTLATKLFLVLHAAAGFGGAYALARREGGLERSGAALVSVVFCAAGFFAWRGARGHAGFLPFYLLPWLLLAWRSAPRSARACAATAGLLALLLVEGGVYPLAFGGVLLGFDAAVRLAAPGPRAGMRRAIVVAAVLVLGLATLLGAARWIPIAIEIASHPRRVPYSDAIGGADLLEMLTARSHSLRVDGRYFLWSEYGAYVGWGAVGLALLGAVRALLAPGRRHWVVGLALFAGLMLGDHGPLSPWRVLQQLPGFEMLRVPSRFAGVALLQLALLAGLGLDAVAAAARRRLGGGRSAPALTAASWLVVGLVFADLFAASRSVVDQWRGPPLEGVQPAAQFQLSDRHEYRRNLARFPRMELGTTGCYEPMRPRRADALWTGPGLQARIEHGEGRVLETARSTRSVSAHVELATPARVVFNQNHAPGWRSAQGEVLADEHGRLAVEAPAGSSRILVEYRPRGFAASLATTLLGVVAAAAVASRGGAARLARWLAGPAQAPSPDDSVNTSITT